MEPLFYDNAESSTLEDEIAHSRQLIALLRGFLGGINEQRTYSLLAAMLLFTIAAFLVFAAYSGSGYELVSLLPSILVLLGYLFFQFLWRAFALARISREAAIICEYQTEITREAESSLPHLDIVEREPRSELRRVDPEPKS